LRFNEDRIGKNSHVTVSPQNHDSLGEAASLQDQPDYIDTPEKNEKLNYMKGNECIFIDPQMNPRKLEKLLEKWNIVLWLQKEVDRLICGRGSCIGCRHRKKAENQMRKVYN